MSLKDDLKRVTGPHKEDIKLQEWVRRQPAATREQSNAQLRASRAFREKYNHVHGHPNHTPNDHRGT